MSSARSFKDELKEALKNDKAIRKLVFEVVAMEMGVDIYNTRKFADKVEKELAQRARLRR